MICDFCENDACVCDPDDDYDLKHVTDYRHQNILIIYFGDFLSDARCVNMAKSILSFGKLLDDNQKKMVSVISTDNIQNINFYEKDDLIQKINFHPITIPQKGIKKYINFYKRVNEIFKKKLFNSVPFDCIISSDLYSLANACKYKKHFGYKIIYDCREIYSDLYAHRKKTLLKLICKIYESYFIKKVDDIIVTADSDKEILSKKYSFINKKKWHLIYNYPKYTNLVDKKMGFNLPKNTIKVIYQGVIQRGRGIKQLIELTHYSQNISSVILGDGPEKNRYIKLTKKLNLEKKIIFIDCVDYLDVFKYTQGADIGWCMIKAKGESNQNALPNKLFEYVMMGLPVISSNLPNIKKIIDCHHIGKIINDDSLKTIEKEIIDLMKNKKNPKHYNNIIKQYFSFELQGFKFVEIIDDGDYGVDNNLAHRDWLNLDDKYSPPKEKRGPTIIGGDKIFTNENKFGN